MSGSALRACLTVNLRFDIVKTGKMSFFCKEKVPRFALLAVVVNWELGSQIRNFFQSWIFCSQIRKKIQSWNRVPRLVKFSNLGTWFPGDNLRPNILIIFIVELTTFHVDDMFQYTAEPSKQGSNKNKQLAADFEKKSSVQAGNPM